MILIKTNHLETGKKITVGSGEIQITGNSAVIYNDMVSLLMYIRKDKRLQEIFTDASERVLSGDATILEE